MLLLRDIVVRLVVDAECLLEQGDYFLVESYRDGERGLVRN